MTDTIDTRHGAVHVFSVDPQSAGVLAEDPAALAAALGVAEVDPTAATVFHARALEGVGLARYLIDGHGMSESALADDRALLDDFDGHLAIVPAHALPDDTAQVFVGNALRHIATYHEDKPVTQFAPLPSDGAKGTVGAAPLQEANGTSRALPLLFLLLIPVLLALLLFWVKT